MLKEDRCNFYYVLEDAANGAPNTVALYYQGKEWTYHEFRLQVHRWANFFLSIEIKSRGFRLLDLCD
jgi:acyl-coenzyme A synthetase/AMP-(fatty) acid ligase